MEIKICRWEDVQRHIVRLKELHGKYGLDYTFKFTNRQIVFVVIEDDGIQTISAFAVLCCPYGQWWLRNFIVDEPYRGRGYQRALTASMIDYAIGVKHAKKLTTAVDQKNTYSLNNFVALGFRFVPGGKMHGKHYYQKLELNL